MSLEMLKTPWLTTDEGFKGSGKWECWREFVMLSLIFPTEMIQKTYPSLIPEEQIYDRSYGAEGQEQSLRRET